MIDRDLGNTIKSMARGFPIVSLTGPRQSGKTTLVRALFPDYAYVNLENLGDRAAAEEDPVRFLGTRSRSGIIIDEAQKVPVLFSYLQGIVDESKEMGKIILTGSQNFLLLEKITQSLAGRVAVCNLLPLGLHELERASMLKADLDTMLFTGTYPALYDRPISPGDYFPSYAQTYIERDVRGIRNIGDLSTFQRFVRLCAGRTGQLLNYSSIGNELGVNYKTVRSWISVLEASYLIFLLAPYHRNYSKRIVKQPKLYFFDTGLLCSLLDIGDPGRLAGHYMRGSIFESFVISEYIKMRLHSGRRPNAFFWRDNAGHEIDLLIEEGDKVRALEIKSGETITDDFFRGLKYFQKISGMGAESSTLIYGGAGDQDRKNAGVLGWRSLVRLGDENRRAEK